MANANDNLVNFTHARVERFECPAARSEAFLWDAKTPALGIRARSGGSKQYIFQDRLHGKTLRLTIGKPGSWDIADARAEARRIRVLIDSGIHPRDEQQQRKVEINEAVQERQRAKFTLGDIWAEYVVARKADWSEAHLKDHKRVKQVPGLPRTNSKLSTKPGVLYALRD